MTSATCAKLLILFGASVLLIAALSAIGLWRSVVKEQSAETIAAWRNAVVLPGAMGTLMMAMSAVRPVIYMGATADTILVWALAASGTALAVSWPVAAITGDHGLSPKKNFINLYIYGGNVVGLVGAITGAVVILIGAINSAMELLDKPF
ncbi:MAG: hypothetical protein IME93_06255 [Proteobacteria bacterium]|nr:hypothetical protein [Pseudomonadota bacterium]